MKFVYTWEMISIDSLFVGVKGKYVFLWSHPMQHGDLLAIGKLRLLSKLAWVLLKDQIQNGYQESFNISHDKVTL